MSRLPAGHECYHCKQWVAGGDAHDCWTTTEAALTRELSEDLRDAWERLRESAAELGEQRIYASHNSIMFSRAVCYCFVRPKRRVLEVCLFLRRTVQSPRIKRATPASRTKIAHILHLTHRDEVEAPLTDWLREAYDLAVTRTSSPSNPLTSGSATAGEKKTRKKAARTARPAAKKR